MPKKEKTVWVVGYGTLMLDYTSYTRRRNGIPIKVFGWERIYNCAAYQKHYAMAANVQPWQGEDIIHRNNNFFNGVMFEISETTMTECLDWRELFYERVQVDVVRYDGHKSTVRPWIYSACMSVVQPTSLCLPGQRDWSMALEGARVIGGRFFIDFLNTTKLADRRRVIYDGKKEVSFYPSRPKKAGCKV